MDSMVSIVGGLWIVNSIFLSVSVVGEYLGIQPKHHTSLLTPLKGLKTNTKPQALSPPTSVAPKLSSTFGCTEVANCAWDAQGLIARGLRGYVEVLSRA